MKRPTSFLYVLILLLISTGVVSAGTTVLTTYYPAPNGNYAQLRLVPQNALSNPCKTGAMYVDTTTGNLQYCDNSNGDLTGVWGNIPGVWKQSGNNIYPTDISVNVGIGIASPGSALHVVGQGQFVADGVGADTGAYGTFGVTRSSSANTLSYIAMTRSGQVVKAMGIDSSNRWIFGLPTAGTQIISTPQMVIEQAGNVGIGVAAPQATLDVNGIVQAAGFLYSSDSRLKKDIHPLTHALDKVQRLNGVAFTWKKNNVKDIGVTAQNVEKVVPELVTTGPNGMKSVEYGNMVALLIESIKEQQKEIEGLKKEVAELQNKYPAH